MPRSYRNSPSYSIFPSDLCSALNVTPTHSRLRLQSMPRLAHRHVPSAQTPLYQPLLRLGLVQMLELKHPGQIGGLQAVYLQWDLRQHHGPPTGKRARRYPCSQILLGYHRALWLPPGLLGPQHKDRQRNRAKARPKLRGRNLARKSDTHFRFWTTLSRASCMFFCFNSENAWGYHIICIVNFCRSDYPESEA